MSSSVCNPPVFAFVDNRSNACVFNCTREFSVHTLEQTDDKTVTVSEKHSSEHPSEGVPIKTVAAVADTVDGCQVVLLFHNVAYTESNNTTITLSRDQMKKGGVHCNLVDMDQAQRENNGVVGNEWLEKDGHKIAIKRIEIQIRKKESQSYPHIQLSPPTMTQLNSLPIVTMTEPGSWCPALSLRSTAKCSYCGNVQCRRRQCMLLHSSGMGVQSPQDIKHGKYWVYRTKKKMSEIMVDQTSQQAEHPLTIRARSDTRSDNLLDLEEQLPIFSSLDENEVCATISRKQPRDFHDKREKNQLCSDKTSAAKDFMRSTTTDSDSEDELTESLVGVHMPDRELKKKLTTNENCYQFSDRASPTTPRCFEKSLFFTDLHNKVLKKKNLCCTVSIETIAGCSNVIIVTKRLGQ